MRISPLSGPAPAGARKSARGRRGASPNDCTRSYIRALTAPPVYPPLASELAAELSSPWDVRMPVNADDDITRIHWQEQRRTDMFERMFDWGPAAATTATTTTVAQAPPGPPGVASSPAPAPCSCVLQPHFSFGSATSPFFAPWQDVGHCLRHLLLHQIGSHQTSASVALVSHDTELFLSTAPNFDEAGGMKDITISKNYYLLRCHHDRARRRLVFGYHEGGAASSGAAAGPFVELREVSLADENWRLETCVILKNLARIINSLKDYAVPLSCCEKLSLVDDEKGRRVQKIYKNDRICDVFDASVENMIEIYGAIRDVPHTDKIVSVDRKEGDGDVVVCQFAPVGRSYLPLDAGELLDALVCVAESLVSLHSMEIMHRDIRWANVFHAFREERPGGCGDVGGIEDSRQQRARRCSEFSREWVLFDFEFAARSPQPALGEHTLTPGNHAPEMIAHDGAEPRPHTTAVDVWGLGYLIQHSEVDLPASHASDLLDLQDACMDPNPDNRPGASYCLGYLRKLQSRPCSREKDVVHCFD